jgi:hypothetical protein
MIDARFGKLGQALASSSKRMVKSVGKNDSPYFSISWRTSNGR